LQRYTFIFFYCLCIVTVVVIVCHWVWALGVWGELACHKRLFNPPPSSQGWAPGVKIGVETSILKRGI
jgi:hypothetical protein